DVEFTVQALQLFHAGRRPALRTGNVLAAIDGLARAEILPARSASVLADGYRWLRRAEHALQLSEEQQTAQLPDDVAGRTRPPRRMGYADEEAADATRRFEADLARTRSRVREQFEALVLGDRIRPRSGNVLAKRFDEVLAGTPLDAHAPASARFAERRGD